MPRIALIVIGQTPRDDLAAELAAVAPADLEIRQVGALDDVELPTIHVAAGTTGKANPLTTRLADGSPVELDEAWLAPHVQRAIDRATTDGADALLLACAGGFDGVTATIPLVRPAEVVRHEVARRGARSVLLVVPIPGQLAAAVERWAMAPAVDVTAIAARLPDDTDAIVEAANDLAEETGAAPVVVLDFVGHPSDLVLDLEDALEAATDADLVDAGRVAAQEAIAVVSG